MNKCESDKILGSLRRRGDYIAAVSELPDVEAWRKEVRRTAREAGLRIRTMVTSTGTHVVAWHIDHESTDIEQAAIARMMEGFLREDGVSWDEAVEQERRSAIRAVPERDKPTGRTS